MNYRACFVIYLRRQAYCPTTVKSYDYALNDYISYFRLIRKRASVLKNFNAQHLESFRKYLTVTRGLRPSTVNRRLTALSAFARFLIKRDLLPYNPLELVARLNHDGTIRARRMAAWEDIQNLRQEVHKDLLELPGRLIVELLYTGASVREIRELRYDANSGTDNLKVGERVLVLHPEARVALSHYLILRPILWGDYLIAGEEHDRFLKPDTVYYILQKLSKKISARVTVRDLRLARFALAPDATTTVEEAA